MFILPKVLLDLIKAFKAAADGKAFVKNGSGWSAVDPPAGSQGIQGEPGADGAPGAPGVQGVQGPAGPGLPAGGTAGQIPAKIDGTDFNTHWVNPPAGAASDLISNLVSAEIHINGAAAATISQMHVCSGTTADYTVTLPSPTAGRLIGLRMAPGLTKLVTLDAGAGALIDGQRYRIMWANETCLLMGDGVNWAKVAGKSIPMGVQVSASAGQSFAANNYTKVALDTLVVASPTAMWSQAAVRVNVLRPGTYQCLANCAANTTNASATWWQNLLKVNNVYADSQNTDLAVGKQSTGKCVSLLTANAGDYLEFFVIFTSGAYTGVALVPGASLTVREQPTW